MTKSAPKKIIHLITGLGVGGAELMLTKILPPTKNEFDHHVVSIISPGPVGSMLTSQGIKVYSLNLRHKLELSIIRKFYRLVKQIKPDILITYLPHADLFGRIIGRLAGIPIIVCSIRGKLWQSKYLPFFILDGLTSPLVSHYHFNSPAIARGHQKYLGTSLRKISIIPNALDVSTMQPNINITKKTLSLNLPQNKIFIGYVAQLRQKKGHPYLIKAMPLIIATRPDTHLVLVGDGAEKSSLVRLVDRLNLRSHVTFLGYRPDVPEILPLLTIFIQPTLYEGMSNSLMEAMAARRPIITTDIPENRDFLAHRVSALLVPRRNPTAIADATINLLDNPSLRSRLSTQAHQMVFHNFSLQSIVQQYHHFFNRL